MIPPLPHWQRKGQPAPPHRHVEFASANQMPNAQHDRNTLHHDLYLHRRQATTAWLHRRFAAIGRILVNCQCERRQVLTPYVPNAGIDSMMTQDAVHRLVNSAGYARVSAT